MDEQLSIFPKNHDADPVDLGKIAAHIAKHARVVIPEDRTSAAAREQGWGTVPKDISLPVTVSRLYEMPGRNRGHVNSHDQPVTPEQAQRGLTEAQIAAQAATNRQGAEVARAVLRNLTD